MVTQLTAEELAARLDEGDSFTLVDTRPADSFEQWHIHGAVNVPFDPDAGFDERHRERVASLAEGGPIVTVCGKGITSSAFGVHLDDSGFEDVSVVMGGMREYAGVTEAVPVKDGADLHVIQLQRRATGCLGYVVGSREAGEAVVVDPTRQSHAFVMAAQAAGLTVTAVVDTHVHADHLSGGRQLAAQLGVPYYLGADVDEREGDHGEESLPDGATLSLGDVEIEALHAPGHTRDMLNLLVDGAYLLSADTLFVDSVGRTELGFGEDGATEGAELLYDTLHETVLGLDDDVTVLPGHVSVSTDIQWAAGSPGQPVHARLGDLREDLDLLGLDREGFVDRLTSDLPEKPADYEEVIAVNAGRKSVENAEEAADLDTGPNNCSA